jgi:hypothetical protein
LGIGFFKEAIDEPVSIPFAEIIQFYQLYDSSRYQRDMPYPFYQHPGCIPEFQRAGNCRNGEFLACGFYPSVLQIRGRRGQVLSCLVGLGKTLHPGRGGKPGNYGLLRLSLIEKQTAV